MKILVITVNSLHLGFLGCYGNDWIETPSVDRLASQGVVFDQHFADRPEPVEARRSWRTGCYHFPTPNDPEGRTGSAVPDLLSIMHENGIATALVLNSRSPAEFATGWDFAETISEGPAEADLEQTLEKVRETLDHLGSAKHWLFWVELTDLFPPWEPPEDLLELYFQDEPEPKLDVATEITGDEDTFPKASLPSSIPETANLRDSDDAMWMRLQGTYAATVTQMDGALGQLLDDLDHAGLSKEVVVVFTSDRGIALEEHNVFGETLPRLHEGLIHLPLIVRLPGEAQAGRRIAALTQPIDLFPTFLNLFGLPAIPVHGHSILPLTTGEQHQIRAYACAAINNEGAIEWGLRTQDWGFILPLQEAPGLPSHPPKLYVKPDDRWEVNNVQQHHQELADHLEPTLRNFVLATWQPGVLVPPPLLDVNSRKPEPEM